MPIIVERESSGDVIAVFARLTIDGHPYEFKVDTGATKSEISASIAHANRLSDDGHAESVSSLGCRAKAQPVRITHWKISALPLPPTTVLAQAHQIQAKIAGEPYAGLLGSDVLSQFSSVTFDFADSRLILEQRRISSSHGVVMDTHRHHDGTAYETVKLRLDGRAGTWIVDTGSPFSLISAKTDKQDHLRSLGHRVQVASATACLSSVQPAELNRWSAGGIQLPTTAGVVSKDPIVETIAGKPIAGILGINVLGNWDRASLLFAKHRLTLVNEPDGPGSPIGIVIVAGLALLLAAIGLVYWRRDSRPTT